MIDNHSFELLVTAQTDTLYRVSMTMLKNEHDAQDAVHEAILLAYQNRNKLRQEQYFGTWLTRILINQCSRVLRQRKRIADVTEPLSDITSRDNPYISVEIGEAIDSLPPKIRLTVILYYIEDYSVKEIKEILHIPEGTVKSRLSKGRRLLKDQLDH
ncbi:MAG: sigma-70 family RNA polymerase sigma factor [Ruminococcus sp.]|uniref:RNA polymerase sigma factor n=1 Tax=Ruminococcus sp. TaxID=41978 RepID=UPI002872C6EB|nr:sigma-70 family RNA polymerase sigma factor [Ruminococcus sp.]MBQ3285653.1 sigma-70 family RNA polymerase sigma factor [Ruminococcus sp.]